MVKKSSVRRALPWLTAMAALATVPVEGAISAPLASAAASSSSTRHIVVAHRVSSLAALGQSSAARGAATTSSASDGLQSPNRSSSYRHASSSNRTAGTTLTVPVVAPTAVSGTSTAVHAFDGIDQYQQRYIADGGNQFSLTPPDQGLCVGNGYVVESVNDALQVFNKSGKTLSPPIGLNAFYGYPPVNNRSTGEQGPEVTDPTCYFDPQYSRWFQVALTLERDRTSGALLGPNHIDIAVSSSKSPLGGWVVYRIPVQDDGTQGTPNHTSCPCIGDYPHIGADQNGFYVTTNEYPFGTGPGVFGNNYNGAQIYALSKFWLAQNSSSVPLVQFSDLTLPNGTPSFTLWPSEVPGTAYDTRHGGTEWFSQSTAAIQETQNPAGMSNNIGIWHLTNTRSINNATPEPRSQAGNADLGDLWRAAALGAEGRPGAAA